jgi:hypothetical protein
VCRWGYSDVFNVVVSEKENPCVVGDIPRDLGETFVCAVHGVFGLDARAIFWTGCFCPNVDCQKKHQQRNQTK